MYCYQRLFSDLSRFTYEDLLVLVFNLYCSINEFRATKETHYLLLCLKNSEIEYIENNAWYFKSQTQTNKLQNMISSLVNVFVDLIFPSFLLLS